MTKVCANPECRKEYTPGHYGKRQRVCGAPACKAWYRAHWRATRRPPRGLAPGDYAGAARAIKADPMFYSLVVCARETGLRKGELLGLTWADLDAGGGRLRPVVEVRGQWADAVGFKLSKRKRSRLGLFSAAARKALAAYKVSANGGGGKGPAAGARVWPISEAWVWCRWVAIQAAHGIKNPETGAPYRFHDLRHTLGVELAKAGRLDLVKEMLDHKRLETSMIYTAQAPEDVLADVERIRGRRQHGR